MGRFYATKASPANPSTLQASGNSRDNESSTVTPEERFIQWLKIAFAFLFAAGFFYAIHLLHVIAYGS